MIKYEDVVQVEHPYLGQFTRSFVFRTEDGDLLVDTGLASGMGILSEIARMPVAVLSTHGHWDHIGCHTAFSDKGIPIYVGHGDERILSDVRSQWSLMYEQFRGEFDIPEARKVIFDSESGRGTDCFRVYSEGDTLSFGDTNLKIMAIPGHSAGSVAIFDMESGFIFTGDTVCGRGFFKVIPQIDDFNLYMATLERLKQIDIECAFTAHGTESLNNHTFHKALSDGLDCCEHLASVAEKFFSRHSEFTIGDLASDLCEAEGKLLGSGACITASALVNHYCVAERCKTKYVI